MLHRTHGIQMQIFGALNTDTDADSGIELNPYSLYIIMNSILTL